MSDVIVASVVMILLVSVSSTIALWVVGMRFLQYRHQQQHEQTDTRPRPLFTSSEV